MVHKPQIHSNWPKFGIVKDSRDESAKGFTFSPEHTLETTARNYTNRVKQPINADINDHVTLIYEF